MTKIVAAWFLVLMTLPAPVRPQQAVDVASRPPRPLISLDDERLVSANIQATSLEEVLEAFTEATGVEIELSGSADESVSASIQSRPVDEALRTILGERSSIGFYETEAAPDRVR